MKSEKTQNCSFKVQFQFDHCCKKVAETTAFLGPPIVVEGNFKTHENFKLINGKRCGKTFADRIVGGFDVKVGEFPWMALLKYLSTIVENEINFDCGGSLITTKHVLTAAHCLYPNKKKL